MMTCLLCQLLWSFYKYIISSLFLSTVQQLQLSNSSIYQRWMLFWCLSPLGNFLEVHYNFGPHCWFVLIFWAIGAHEEKCRSKLFERKFSFQNRDIIIQEDFTGDVGEIVWEMVILCYFPISSSNLFDILVFISYSICGKSDRISKEFLA